MVVVRSKACGNEIREMGLESSKRNPLVTEGCFLPTDFKPSFDKQPVDSSLSAAVGGNITIICNPEAAPGPTDQWLRNGNDLGLVQGGAPSNGFQMLLNGNLFITNINTGHEGTYTCKVTNANGEASSSGYLRVFRECCHDLIW